MTIGLTVRYPVPDPEDDLDDIIAGLEEGWAEVPESTSRYVEDQWAIEKAARICPVFRFIAGGRAG